MKGIYCLIIKIKKNINQKIGKLGNVKFSKGNYVYVGSAQNGIKKRVERHLKKNKKKYWHIDYLLTNKNVKIKKILYKKAKKQEECKIANFFKKFAQPINKFGCSDCNCVSHLFRLKGEKIKRLGMKGL